MTNLILNPNGTYGLGAWTDTFGWSGLAVSPNGLQFRTDPISGNESNSVVVNYDSTTVTAGTVYQFSGEFTRRLVNDTPKTDGYIVIDIRFLVSGSWVDYKKVKVQTTGVSQTITHNATAPAGSTVVSVRIDTGNLQTGDYAVGLFGNGWLDFTNMYLGVYTPSTTTEATPPPPAVVPPVTGLNISLEIQDANPALSNLVTNPHGELNTFGWVSSASNTLISTVGTAPWTFVRATALAGQAVYYTSELFPVTPSWYLGGRLHWGGSSPDARVGVSVDWYNASKVFISSTAIDVVNPATATDEEYNLITSAPATAYHARLRLTQYRWDGGANVNAWSNDYIEFREATAIQSSVIGDVGNLAAWQADTHTTWIDVIEPSHEILINRDNLDVGLLTATVLKDSYDPASGGFIKPGRKVRVRTFANDAWTNLYQGKIDNVKVTYPRSATTRINITASDNIGNLSGSASTIGVYRVADLPFILKDKGIGWSCNDSSNQVASATTVSTNDSASTIDQVIVTRDSDNAYAWVDRNNILNVKNRSLMSSTPVVEFSDVANGTALYDSYSRIDVGFDTSQCINIVDIVYLHYAAGVTTEVKYGPYLNGTSITTWGAYKAEFTLHGITETEGNMSAFATEVFTKNATPTVKVNSLVMPVKDNRGRAHAAAIDLYSMVGVKYTTKVDADLRVVGINHNIRPELWTVEYTFEKSDSVAVPLWTPSVT